jgi:hypothetical protein
MKLTDLDPAWLTPDVFIFRSPTGHGNWITCKRVPMTRMEQQDLIYGEGSPYIGQPVVATVPEMAWSFEGNDFATMTVMPSIDASASGNWHGFITNGEIR